MTSCERGLDMKRSYQQNNERCIKLNRRIMLYVIFLDERTNLAAIVLSHSISSICFTICLYFCMEDANRDKSKDVKENESLIRTTGKSCMINHRIEKKA